MPTKGLFPGMLNQKSIQTPQVTGSQVNVKKAPGVGQFAFLGQGNSLYRHPMENRGNDVSGSVWARMLGTKTKGVKNG